MTYRELYKQVKNDPRHHITNAQIQEFLDRGYEVQSRALGRFGIVIATSKHDNCVDFKHSKKARTIYCTIFTSGDPVEFKIEDEYKRVVIVHPKWVAEALFNGDSEVPQETLDLLKLKGLL